MSLPKNLCLYVVRHGETEWSLSGQYTGRTDIPLTAHGDDEGRLTADILASRPDWNLFRDGSPHGESPAQISARADRLIARLRALEGNVALFCHGHIGRVLAARWIGLSVAQAQHLLLDIASLGVLSYEHDQTDAPAIALWNSGAQGAA